MNTHRAPFASDNSRLMSCRSTRSCRSIVGKSATSTCNSPFQCSTPAMASLNVFSTAWRSLSVQRRMNGNAARLRANRMRLEMTISLCGPEPRSHSPQRMARSSSLFMVMATWPLGRSLAFALSVALLRRTLFQLANLVANLGGPFIVLFLLRLVHLSPQADQLGLLVGAAGMAARPLAHVLRLAVNVCDQR